MRQGHHTEAVTDQSTVCIQFLPNTLKTLLIYDTFRLIGGYRPYRPQGGGGYYGGYPSDHHHQYNHGYPGDGSYGTGQGGFAPAGTGPVAPVAVNPSGACN